jgi:hypothetical protein
MNLFPFFKAENLDYIIKKIKSKFKEEFKVTNYQNFLRRI